MLYCCLDFVVVVVGVVGVEEGEGVWELLWVCGVGDEGKRQVVGGD